VLIAGKGHEDYQEVAGVRHPFSDVEEALVGLKKRGLAA
jgi:UDP-N-acetylmuramyl tripeptide synthase